MANLIPRRVLPFNVALLPPNFPLSALANAMFFAILEFQKMLGADVPTIPKDTELTSAQAKDSMRNMSLKLFPGLRAA